MSIATEIGLPRGGRGRIRLDMNRVLSLRAEGYSLRQIAKAFGVSDATVRLRLREHTKAAPDPYFSALGKKGQRARRRALKRRRAEAEAQEKREKAEKLRNELIMLAVAERLDIIPTLVAMQKGERAGPEGPA